MKRVFTLLAAVAMMLGLSGAAQAVEHGHPWPEHGHIKLLHAEWTGSGPSTVVTSYMKCIDVAGGNTNDHAHHTTIHMGRAGQALAKAGHLVIPTSPLGPFAGCEALESVFPPS